MKNRVFAVLAAAVAVTVSMEITSQAAIIYNPVVTLVGDGNAIASGAGVTTSIQLFKNSVSAQSAPVASISYNGLVTTNSTVEGMLSNSPALADAAAAGLPYSGTGYVFSAGYAGSDGAAGVVGNGTTTGVNRVVGYVQVGVNSLTNATVAASQSNTAAYAGSTFRAAAGDDTATNFWTAGTAGSGLTATAGFRYFNSNTQIPTTNTVTNTRTVEVRNGQVFGGSSSINVGVYAIGTGLAGANGSSLAGQTSNLLITTGTSSDHAPEAFVLLTDPSNPASTATTFGFNTAYIADDGSAGSELASSKGIEKWVWDGSNWNNVYTISDGTATGYRGLAAQLDKSTGNVILWSTTQDGKNLEQFSDLISGTSSASAANSSELLLATAPSNDLFRGVALAPAAPAATPEPASLLMIGLGSAGLLVRRRSSRA
jgi:hypothetical protein